jgi:hypothetical protein
VVNFQHFAALGTEVFKQIIDNDETLTIHSLNGALVGLARESR